MASSEEGGREPHAHRVCFDGLNKITGNFFVLSELERRMLEANTSCSRHLQNVGVEVDAGERHLASEPLALPPVALIRP
eukprot:3916242-Rhodomonas_salina.1